MDVIQERGNGAHNNFVVKKIEVVGRADAVHDAEYGRMLAFLLENLRSSTGVSYNKE